MASGILPCLKNKWPHAKITWVVQEEYTQILHGSEYVDHIISIKRREFSRLLKNFKLVNFFEGISLTIRELRKEFFDIVMDLQGIWKSSIWALCSRADKKIVVDPKEGVKYFYLNKIFSKKGDKRIGAEYKILLNSLGIGDKDYSAAVYISNPRVNIEKRYVVLSPFTTRTQKLWIDEYWQEIVRFLEQKRYNVVVLGGKSDRERFNRIFSFSNNVIDLVGKLSINESFGVIKGAWAQIGVDTGLTHLGMLLKIPTIAIFGSTCPYLDTGYEKGIVLYKNSPCSPCKRNPTCGGEFSCMKDIRPSEVISILDNWL